MKYVKAQIAHKTKYKLKIQAENMIVWRQNTFQGKSCTNGRIQKQKLLDISK